ncbi:hypothetical protein SALBM217S_03128 [Streptomyces griseoloalbus]
MRGRRLREGVEERGRESAFLPLEGADRLDQVRQARRTGRRRPGRHQGPGRRSPSAARTRPAPAPPGSGSAGTGSPRRPRPAGPRSPSGRRSRAGRRPRGPRRGGAPGCAGRPPARWCPGPSCSERIPSPLSLASAVTGRSRPLASLRSVPQPPDVPPVGHDAKATAMDDRSMKAVLYDRYGGPDVLYVGRVPLARARPRRGPGEGERVQRERRRAVRPLRAAPPAARPPLPQARGPGLHRRGRRARGRGHPVRARRPRVGRPGPDLRVRQRRRVRDRARGARRPAPRRPRPGGRRRSPGGHHGRHRAARQGRAAPRRAAPRAGCGGRRRQRRRPARTGVRREGHGPGPRRQPGPRPRVGAHEAVDHRSVRPADLGRFDVVLDTVGTELRVCGAC